MKSANVFARQGRILLPLILFAASGVLPGRALPVAGKAAAVSPNAAVIASRVDTHYNRLRSLRVEFTETYQGMGMTRTERGTLLLEKSGRMKWLYADPAGKVFVLDGKYGYSYTPGDAQAVRYPVKQLDDFRSPLRFLLGHTKIEKEFTGLTMSPDGADFVLRGTPKGMGPQVSSVTLTVTADGTIAAIAWQDADGATTTFRLTDEQPDAGIPPDAFRFQPPQGIGVVQGLPPV